MKVLTEKLLLEESNFEDTELDTPGVDEVNPESIETDEVGVDTHQEETPVTDEMSASQTTYKVSYKLGKHSNWSRVDATSEEEAKQTVQDYITSKWSDRKYEFVDIEEFNEEEMSETLNEAVYDVQPTETEAAVGMSMIISDLIKDEYEAIDGYSSAIVTAEAEGYGDMVRVLTDIQAEEHVHIGQLQELLKMVDPNASKVEEGQVEGVEQLSDVPPVEPEYEETV